MLCARILVQHPHVAVGGRAVQVEPVFVDVLAVVALVAGEAEHALFENGIAAVPQSEGKDEHLEAVTDSGDTILAPAVGSAARHVVGEEVPGRAVRTVVFAHRTPGALADIWSPFPPGFDRARVLFPQPLVFRSIWRL